MQSGLSIGRFNGFVLLMLVTIMHLFLDDFLPPDWRFGHRFSCKDIVNIGKYKHFLGFFSVFNKIFSKRGKNRVYFCFIAGF